MAFPNNLQHPIFYIEEPNNSENDLSDIEDDTSASDMEDDTSDLSYLGDMSDMEDDFAFPNNLQHPILDLEEANVHLEVLNLVLEEPVLEEPQHPIILRSPLSSYSEDSDNSSLSSYSEDSDTSLSSFSGSFSDDSN
jgi:hypothetical protein